MRHVVLSLIIVATLMARASDAQITSSCPDPCLKLPKTSIAVTELAPIDFAGSTNTLTATMAPGRKKTLRLVTAQVTLQNATVDSNTTVYLRCSSNYQLQGEQYAQASCLPGSYCGGQFAGVIDMDDAVNLSVLGLKAPLTVVCGADYAPPPVPGAISRLAIAVTEVKK